MPVKKIAVLAVADLMMLAARTAQKAKGEDTILTRVISGKDLKKIGDIMWENEFRGSKRAEVEHHTYKIYHYISMLREANLGFIGMSSVGLSIAVITEKQKVDRKNYQTDGA